MKKTMVLSTTMFVTLLLALNINKIISVHSDRNLVVYKVFGVVTDVYWRDAGNFYDKYKTMDGMEF